MGCRRTHLCRGISWTDHTSLDRRRGLVMSSEITLTRKQLERIITHIALDDGIESVTVIESHESGIGASHRALFNKSQIERSFEADITDVEMW